MSLDASIWAWKKQLKPHLKLVLLSLADRANSDFECHPKNSTLAKDTCQSERSVKRQLEELVSLGLIADSGKRVGRTNKTKVWRLIGAIDRTNSDTQSPLNGDTQSQLQTESGHSVPFNGDTQSPLNGDTQSPSYIEPSIVESSNGTPLVAEDNQAPPTTLVFNAYVEGMKQRYGQGVNPARNAKVNGMLKNMVERIGRDNAILVARNYPLHQNSWYVQKIHSIDAMLHDCESLLVQVQSGQMITKTHAYQADKSGHYQNQVNQSEADPRNREVF